MLKIFLNNFLCKIKGKNNLILDETGKRFHSSKLKIKIIGNNNKVVIDNSTKFNKKSKIIIEGNNNSLTIKQNCKFNGELNCDAIGNNIKINFEENIFVVDELTIHSNENRDNISILIGKDTSSYKTLITAVHSNTNVIIGEDCMFSYNTFVYNTDGHPIFDNDTHEIINRAKNIEIGNHVWVGYGSTILKNVKIVDNSIIGRGAIVTKSFNEGNCVIAGNPAKICKKNINWQREDVDW